MLIFYFRISSANIEHRDTQKTNDAFFEKEISEIDSPRIQSDIDDNESHSDDEQKDVLSESQKLEIKKLQYYGKFSYHNDPDAMVGLIAVRKGLTNDFTAAENSGPADFFQTYGDQQLKIE